MTKARNRTSPQSLKKLIIVKMNDDVLRAYRNKRASQRLRLKRKREHKQTDPENTAIVLSE